LNDGNVNHARKVPNIGVAKGRDKESDVRVTNDMAYLPIGPFFPELSEETDSITSFFHLHTDSFSRFLLAKPTVVPSANQDIYRPLLKTKVHHRVSIYK
jgi:hypothetical protein